MNFRIELRDIKGIKLHKVILTSQPTLEHAKIRAENACRERWQCSKVELFHGKRWNYTVFGLHKPIGQINIIPLTEKGKLIP